MFKASRDFIVLSLDGYRAVEEHLQEQSRATRPSILDHYCVRPTTPSFNDVTLSSFAQQYSTLRAEPTRRRKQVVVVPHPYCSPDPSGPKYKQYCQQWLMLHQPFHNITDLLAGYETYAAAYAAFLNSAPTSLEDDVYGLQQKESEVYTTEVVACKLCMQCTLAL